MAPVHGASDETPYRAEGAPTLAHHEERDSDAHDSTENGSHDPWFELGGR